MHVLTAFKCPANCKCSAAFKSVDCSHQQLIGVPTDLPLKTVRLDLSHNQLTSLNISHLVGCIFLHELILSDNQIEVIHDNAVGILYKYAELTQLHMDIFHL